MLLLIFSSLIWISLADLRSHRIPNRALMVLTLTGLGNALLNGHDWKSHAMAALIILCLSLCGWKIFGLGMGDVKLLGLLSFLLIPADSFGYQSFTVIFTVAAIMHVAISTKGRFNCDQALPLAPSLSLATVLVHLI